MNDNHAHNEHAQVEQKPISWTNIILLVAAGVLLFGMGYKYSEIKNGRSAGVSRDIFSKEQDSTTKRPSDFSLFWDVWNKMEEKYVDSSKINAEKMYYGAIKGMVASVQDPYTFFLTPEENKKSKDDLGGKFEGIGAQLGMKDGAIVIIAPLKNSPAITAGLRAGDIITKVDGESVQGWTLNQAVGKIRGEKGTKVKLTILRNGEEQTFELTRDTIQVDSVELSYEQRNGSQIAVLKVNQFGETTNLEWDTAVEDIQQKFASGEVKGMVLDLRDNPGGYLESSVYLAEDFLPEGKLIVKQESTIEEDKQYNVERTGRLLTIPVAVLINQGSASASEILSGALRDHKRATLLGEKSFGKGSVQEALDLAKGSGLHVTVAKWILPAGEWINGKGIMPSIEVKNELEEGNTLTKETDTQLQRAMDELTK